jgi:hypothetical protein
LALQTADETKVAGARYFLLQLGAVGRTLIILPFTAPEIEQATNEYLRIERDIGGQPGKEAVLVSVSSLAALRSAYPSYFLDTERFLTLVREAIS